MRQRRLGFVLSLLVLVSGGALCESTPTPTARPVAPLQPAEASLQGWYCYEGNTLGAGAYHDSSTYCDRDLERCRSSRTSVGIAGKPPPAELTECSRRDEAVCGAFQIPGREGAIVPPLEHCHATAADCARKQASLKTQPATIVVRRCAVMR